MFSYRHKTQFPRRADAYLFMEMFKLWYLSGIPFDFLDCFCSFRDGQFRPVCLLVTKRLREYNVWALMLLSRQKGTPKII